MERFALLVLGGHPTAAAVGDSLLLPFLQLWVPRRQLDPYLFDVAFLEPDPEPLKFYLAIRRKAQLTALFGMTKGTGLPMKRRPADESSRRG